MNAPTSCSPSPTTSSSSVGGTPNGRGSLRSSRRTSRSRPSRRTRSDTRERSTSSPPRELGTTADELAFDRTPEEYRSAPLVELRRLEWARTIARHWLYETADEIRIARSEVLRRPGDRRPRGQDRPRGGVPPDARGDVDRPPARDGRGSHAAERGDRRALAVRARRPRRRAPPGSRRASPGATRARARPTSSPFPAASTRPSSPSCGRR